MFSGSGESVLKKSSQNTSQNTNVIETLPGTLQTTLVTLLEGGVGVSLPSHLSARCHGWTQTCGARRWGLSSCCPSCRRGLVCSAQSCLARVWRVGTRSWCYKCTDTPSSSAGQGGSRQDWAEQTSPGRHGGQQLLSPQGRAPQVWVQPWNRAERWEGSETHDPTLQPCHSRTNESGGLRVPIEGQSPYLQHTARGASERRMSALHAPPTVCTLDFPPPATIFFTFLTAFTFFVFQRATDKDSRA